MAETSRATKSGADLNNPVGGYNRGLPLSIVTGCSLDGEGGGERVRAANGPDKDLVYGPLGGFTPYCYCSYTCYYYYYYYY